MFDLCICISETGMNTPTNPYNFRHIYILYVLCKQYYVLSVQSSRHAPLCLFYTLNISLYSIFLTYFVAYKYSFHLLGFFFVSQVSHFRTVNTVEKNQFNGNWILLIIWKYMNTEEKFGDFYHENLDVFFPLSTIRIFSVNNLEISALISPFPI